MEREEEEDSHCPRNVSTATNVTEVAAVSAATASASTPSSVWGKLAPYVCPSTLRQLKTLLSGKNPWMKATDLMPLLRDVPGNDSFVRRERKLRKQRGRKRRDLAECEETHPATHATNVSCAATSATPCCAIAKRAHQAAATTRATVSPTNAKQAQAPAKDAKAATACRATDNCNVALEADAALADLASLSNSGGRLKRGCGRWSSPGMRSVAQKLDRRRRELASESAATLQSLRDEELGGDRIPPRERERELESHKRKRRQTQRSRPCRKQQQQTNCRLRRIIGQCRGTLALQTPDEADKSFLWRLASSPRRLFNYHKWRRLFAARARQLLLPKKFSSTQPQGGETQGEQEDEREKRDVQQGEGEEEVHDQETARRIEDDLFHFVQSVASVDELFCYNATLEGTSVVDRWGIPRHLQIRAAPLTKVHLAIALSWRIGEKSNPLNLRPCSQERSCIANRVLGDGFVLYEFPPYGYLQAFASGLENRPAQLPPSHHPGNALCFPCRISVLQSPLLNPRRRAPVVDVWEFGQFYDLSYPDLKDEYVTTMPVSFDRRQPVAKETGVQLPVCNILLLYTFLRDLRITQNGLDVTPVCR